MTRLSWGNAGERHYEAGVDCGVLYVTGKDGVVWNGLVSVAEAPSGGDPTPYYVDGIKVLNISSIEEFVATLNALSSPSEFDACDGAVAIHNGLFATQQPRQSFGLCYRTKIGDDIDGIDHGYKIHLVYGALAAASSRENTTLNKSATPIEFSWNITTTPPLTDAYRPTAHLVIDSTLADQQLLSILGGFLYGAYRMTSRQSTPDQLIYFFANWIHRAITPEIDFQGILEDYAHIPVVGQTGDAWLIDEDLWVYDGGWVNKGPVPEIMPLFNSYLGVEFIVDYDNGAYYWDGFVPIYIGTSAPIVVPGEVVLWLDDTFTDWINGTPGDIVQLNLIIGA